MTIPTGDLAALRDMRDFGYELAVILEDTPLEGYPRDLAQQRAVERVIMLIGEAARGVSAPTCAALSDIPWRRIIGLRNIVAHAYRSVKQERLWHIAAQEVPSLVRRLDAVLPPEPLPP